MSLPAFTGSTFSPDSWYHPLHKLLSNNVKHHEINYFCEREIRRAKEVYGFLRSCQNELGERTVNDSMLHPLGVVGQFMHC